MELPTGFGVEGAHPIEWVIILDKNVYILKDAGLAWFDKLKEGLEDRDVSNHNWTHLYGTRKKWSYYYMLMDAYCSLLLSIKLIK